MLRKILVLGAGKSTSYLLDYFLEKSYAEKLHLTIGDINPDAIPASFRGHDNCTVMHLDILKDTDRKKAIIDSDIVVSMLPARFHIKVAEDCLDIGRHLVTASYVSKEIKTLDEKVKDKGLVFMNEIGLDPGIDHMSAMQIIDNIRAQGGKMLLFESFTGGLVAPESDNNLWNYKFTWNPRNVVLAGQGVPQNSCRKALINTSPITKLFRRTEFFEIEGYGRFEGYANRDS